MRELALPIVIKPLAGNHGRGCTLGVSTLADVRSAFARATAIDKRVLIEEQVQGRDYRIVVVGGKVAAASERKPAHVAGDGVSTIAQLSTAKTSIQCANGPSQASDTHRR